MRCTSGDANTSDHPYLANNILHSLFADCTVSANGIKLSTANGHSAHKCFIETDFSHGTDAKKTWLKCQDYQYEENPGPFPAATSDMRRTTVRQSARLTLYGKSAVDFFSCEKHLVSGITLGFSMRRSQVGFAVISEDAAKHYLVKIDETNLFTRKMTVSDNVFGAIEKTLLKTPAASRYDEVITETFLAKTGQQSWKHEGVFTKEPIRRVIVALCVGTAVTGTNTANSFHYQKFGLREITIYRNGFVTAGTPMSKSDNERLYYNSMIALAYLENCKRIPLSEFANHYIMVFDLISTQETT